MVQDAARASCCRLHSTKLNGPRSDSILQQAFQGASHDPLQEKRRIFPSLPQFSGLSSRRHVSGLLQHPFRRVKALVREKRQLMRICFPASWILQVQLPTLQSHNYRWLTDPVIQLLGKVTFAILCVSITWIEIEFPLHKSMQGYSITRQEYEYLTFVVLIDGNGELNDLGHGCAHAPILYLESI